MNQQFQEIYEWQDKSATSLSKYINWWNTKDNNNNKKRNQKITDCVKMEEEKKDRKLISDFKHMKDFFGVFFL